MAVAAAGAGPVAGVSSLFLFGFLLWGVVLSAAALFTLLGVRCARVAELTTPLLMHLHDAQSVEQINGTPDGAVCAVTGKELTPKLGVQLKFNKYHVCVHPEV